MLDRMDALGSVTTMSSSRASGLLDAALALGGVGRPGAARDAAAPGAVTPIAPADDPLRPEDDRTGRDDRPGEDRAVARPAGLDRPDRVTLSPDARGARDGDEPIDGDRPARSGDDGSGSDARSTDAAASTDDAAAPRGTDGEPLSEDERTQVDELQARDREVRAHEQAHKSAGGQYAGAISYSYQRGPDGRRYAVGGSVPIDVSPVAGDPQATIRKMQQVRRAALAPAEPSSADRQVAQQASRTESEARRAMAQSRQEQDGENGGPRSAAAGDGGVAGTAAASDGPLGPGSTAASGVDAAATGRRRFETGLDPRSTVPPRTAPALVDVVG